MVRETVHRTPDSCHLTLSCHTICLHDTVASRLFPGNSENMKIHHPEKHARPSTKNDSASEYIASLVQLSSRRERINISSPEDNLLKFREFLKAEMYPDKRHTIHVAGSKGKGSTVHFIDVILRAASANTYRFTSPDIHSVRERIAINGKPISQKHFVSLLKALDSDA